MITRSLVLRIVFLAIIDALAINLAIQLGAGVSPLLGIGIGLFVIVFNIVFFTQRLAAWRWIMPALAGMFLLVIYPIGYSVIVAFTNYGDGHILTKEQVISQKTSEMYTPPEANTYQVYVYRDAATEAFRFYLIDRNGKTFVYTPGDAAMREVTPDDAALGAPDENGVPTTLDGFSRLTGREMLQFSQTLQNFTIEAPPNEVRFTRISPRSDAQTAEEQQPRWSYDPVENLLTNRETGQVYREQRGNFVTGEGETLVRLEPGFPAFIGLDNITRVITDPSVRDPFWRVFLWTLAFAGGSVLTTLTLGMGFALVLNSKILPLKPLWRSILIIPYAVPGWLVVTTWRGLMNPLYGPINMGIQGLIGTSPQWFSDPLLAKIGILLVNLYLGFPYMMLISLGALQSIPNDMYEAATIDGANVRQQFRFITLPMLLIALAPLLVASFSYNFNNFTIIELFNRGGPPISAATVAGHTDILLSYTYRLAFSGAAGADYGFAAAIGIFIFMIVGPITYFNFRLTRQLEEVNA